MDEYTLSVPDMGCDGCEQRVRTAVADVEGVQRVEADHETGVVEVTADAPADTVREAIERSGYDVQR